MKHRLIQAHALPALLALALAGCVTDASPSSPAGGPGATPAGPMTVGVDGKALEAFDGLVTAEEHDGIVTLRPAIQYLADEEGVADSGAWLSVELDLLRGSLAPSLVGEPQAVDGTTRFAAPSSPLGDTYVIAEDAITHEPGPDQAPSIVRALTRARCFCSRYVSHEQRLVGSVTFSAIEPGRLAGELTLHIDGQIPYFQSTGFDAPTFDVALEATFDVPVVATR